MRAWKRMEKSFGLRVYTHIRIFIYTTNQKELVMDYYQPPKIEHVQYVTVNHQEGVNNMEDVKELKV